MRAKYTTFFIAMIMVAAWLVLPSCATYYHKNARFQEYFSEGNMEKALSQLDKQKKASEGRNKLLYYLNKGTVSSLLGNYKESNDHFMTADRIAEDYRKNAGLAALSLLTNPMVEPYPGEAFEQVMIHYYTTRNFMSLGDYEAAIVEARRMNLKLQKINDNPLKRIRYKQDAFAHLLMGMMYEATGDDNNAFIAYRNALEVYENEYSKNYGVGPPKQLEDDLLRSAYFNGFKEELDYYEMKFNRKYEHTYNKENGEVVFFWQNGLGPVKAEWGLTFTVVPGAGGLVTFHNEDLGLNFPFYVDDKDDKQKLTNLKFVRAAFPKFVERPPVYNSATLKVAGKERKLELVQDINAIAFANLEDRMLREMGEALLRLALKQATEIALRKQNEEVGFIVGIANAVTEKADTRNWQTLPHDIYYQRLSLAPGTHTLELNTFGNKGAKNTHTVEVKVEKGKTTFVSFQSLESVPVPLTIN